MLQVTQAATGLPEAQTQTLALTGQPTYDSAAKQFQAWLNGRKLSEATLREYFWELSQVRRPATYNLHRSAIKAALVKAAGPSASAGTLERLNQLFRSIKPAKVDKTVYADEVLTQNEIKELCTKATPRIAALVAFLYASGLRISEALSIRLSDITDKGELQKIRVLGKGRKERVVYVPAATVQTVRKAFQRPNQTWLFESRNGTRYSRQYFDRELRKAASAILGKSFGCHTLRHSHATALLKAGESLKAVSQNLGHADPGFTAKCYIHDTVSESAILQLDLLNKPNEQKFTELSTPKNREKNRENRQKQKNIKSKSSLNF